jgi:hypothetical protein
MQWVTTHSVSVAKAATIDKLLLHSLKPDIPNQSRFIFQHLLPKLFVASDTLLLSLKMVSYTAGGSTVCNNFQIATHTKILIVHPTLFLILLF